MAKGVKRGNRELRKPKAKKAARMPTVAPALGKGLTALNGPPRKKS